MKIYLAGSIVGSYRAQNIIKVIGDLGLKYSYTPFTYLLPTANGGHFSSFLALTLGVLTIPFRVILIALSSHVIVLPMNTTSKAMFEIIFAKILRKKIIVDYYISQYDTIVNDLQLTIRNSLRGKIALFKDRFLLKAADTVIFLNHSESTYYQRVAGVKLSAEVVSIIPLCIDYKRELFDNKRREDGSFNVCWWGTYIPLHGLENVIKSFSHISNNKIKLYIFGNSDTKSKPYIDLIKSLGLESQVIVNNSYSFSNGKLAPFLSQHCDLAIGNFGTSEKAKTVLVNKLVDALSLGIPCLTMETRAIVELLQNSQGLVISESDPQSIATQIEKYSLSEEILKEIGEAGKRAYFDLFSPDSFKVKLIGVLKSNT